MTTIHQERPEQSIHLWWDDITAPVDEAAWVVSLETHDVGSDTLWYGDDYERGLAVAVAESRRRGLAAYVREEDGTLSTLFDAQGED